MPPRNTRKPKAKRAKKSREKRKKPEVTEGPGSDKGNPPAPPVDPPEVQPVSSLQADDARSLEMTRAALLQGRDILEADADTQVQQTFSEIGPVITAMLQGDTHTVRVDGVKLGLECVRHRNRTKQLDNERFKVVHESETIRFVSRQQSAVDSGGGKRISSAELPVFTESVLKALDAKGFKIVPTKKE
jgi:hypothetical protein